MAITGDYPFDLDDIYENMLKYKELKVNKFKEKKIPGKVIKFINECLTLNYKERPSAKDLLS